MPQARERVFTISVLSGDPFDFDDLMTSCLRLLRDDAETLAQWQSQFRYILVDEFQDISPVQYEIIRLLAAPENNLFVVGDDDQSIYGFRGASPDCMKRFLTDYARAKQILLDVNFRCHGDIVQAAAKVIAENESRIPRKSVPRMRTEQDFSFFVQNRKIC